jgi:putative transposase
MRSTIPTFIHELPLRTRPADERILAVRLDHAARQIYNACLGETLTRIATLRERRRYRRALALPAGDPERTQLFKDARHSCGFTDSSLQAYALRVRRRMFAYHLDAQTAQKLATRAYDAANQYLLGRRGRPRFKGYRRLHSVEGKSNDAGIRWRDDRVEWLGLRLSAIIDDRDPVTRHALAAPVKYVRLVRRRVRSVDRFSVQLVLEGEPFRKPEHVIGNEEIGIDLGPSTVAAVGETRALLVPLCPEVARTHKHVRRVQRHLDRQRRANNPANYLPDGQAKPGRHRWTISHHQRRTLDELIDLRRREAAHRKTLHGQLANRILSMGTVIRKEKDDYRAWQREFGRTVGLRAPGLFTQILRRKAASAGGGVCEFPSEATKLSSACHCGTITKKSLRERVHRCGCGVTMQRDLYSAYLARFVDTHHVLHAGQAQTSWPGADPLLRAAWSAAVQSAKGRLRPSAFGPAFAAARSQSASPAPEGVQANAEAQEVVAVALLNRESPGEAAVIPLRTPRL